MGHGRAFPGYIDELTVQTVLIDGSLYCKAPLDAHKTGVKVY